MSPDDNPYASPEADPSAPLPRSRPGLLWKLYAVCIGAWWTLSFSQRLGPFRATLLPLDYVGMGLLCISYTGMIGWVGQLRIGARRFWRAWIVLALTCELLYTFVLPQNGLTSPVPPFGWTTVAILSCVVPLYVAVYRYGWRSDELWSMRRGSPDA